jgi:hypothetical protein
MNMGEDVGFRRSPRIGKEAGANADLPAFACVQSSVAAFT